MLRDVKRFVARFRDKWHTPSLFSPLAFNNCCELRNIDYCINTADDSSTSDKNFLNFGPVTSEILWWVCREWVGARK